MKFYMFLVVIILVVIFITQGSLGAPSNKTYEEPNVEKKLKIVITEEEDIENSDSIEEYYDAPESLDFEETFNIENYDEIEAFKASSSKEKDKHYLAMAYNENDDWLEYSKNEDGENWNYYDSIRKYFGDSFETGELKESNDSSESYSSASSTSMETHTGHEVYN